MNAMAFWSKSCGFNGWRKAHFVEGAWHTTACSTSKTLDELNAHGDHWELVTVEEAQARFAQANYQPVSEINEERFMDMLEVLPPLDWRGTADSQSFKLSEMYSGNITDILPNAARVISRCATTPRSHTTKLWKRLRRLLMPRGLPFKRQ